MVAPSTPSRTPVHSSVYGTIITTTTTLRKARRPTEGLLWRSVGRLIHYLSSSHAPHPAPSTRCRTPPHHHLRVIPTVFHTPCLTPSRLHPCLICSGPRGGIGPCSSSAASSSSGHRMILMSISVHNCLASQFASYIPPPAFDCQSHFQSSHSRIAYSPEHSRTIPRVVLLIREFANRLHGLHELAVRWLRVCDI